MLSSYLPVLVMLVIAVGFGVLLALAARGLGPYRPNPEKQLPYESGKDQTSPPRLRFDVKFYRIALLFLVFDIEAAFFYPWAVMFRKLSCQPASMYQDGVCRGTTTPFGILVMLVFLAVLLLALLFVWRKKALEWD